MKVLKNTISVASNKKIHYLYIVSLYPMVNVFDEYAVGFNKYVNNLKVADIEVVG